MADIQDDLATALLRSLAAAISAGSLPTGLVLPDSITLERPKNRDHGDYATSIALALATVSYTHLTLPTKRIV